MKKTTNILLPIALSALMVGSTVATVPAYAQIEAKESQTVAPQQEISMKLEQTGSIYDVRKRLKVKIGPSNRQSTGIYKNMNDVIEIYVDPSTDQSVMPQYVISPIVLTNYSEGNKPGITLRKGRNVITDGTGIIHLINESEPTQNPVTVTISGGQELPSFILGKHTDDDWEMIKRSHPNAPGFELVSKHVIITGGSKSISLVQSPNELMRAHDKAIEEQYRVAGLDSSNVIHQPAPMKHHMRETSESGYWMYAFFNHTAYASDAMDRILNSDTFQRNGWGPWHEVGHTNQMDVIDWSGLGEVTNNIYSMSVQRYFGNNSRLEEDQIYDKVFDYLGQKNNDFNKIDDVFVKLAMFWQLDLAYGKNFYPSLHKAYRELTDQPGSDAVKQQRFIRLASQTANRNLTPFFEKWGLMVTEETKQLLASLPDLDKKIWGYRDNMDDVALAPPTGLQATDIQSNRVTFQWDPSEGDIIGYDIYRNGSLRARVFSTEFTDTNVEADMEYRYTVKSIDVKGNESQDSNEIVVKTKQESPSSYEQWNRDKIYNKGDRVQYEGLDYEAKYWTQGNTPGSSDNWKLLSEVILPWSSNKAYEGGDKVTYNGVVYMAKWWTKGEIPDKSSVWEQQ
ncbi:M60 family metallopeptidase [Paenibacillus thiaminolyticus]|uniref:M60 family metallopeptidase n=1 Tax=Paenibacillus thiaminolyticus TaxID=49283 RepID=UPI0035A641D4